MCTSHEAFEVSAGTVCLYSFDVTFAVSLYSSLRRLRRIRDRQVCDIHLQVKGKIRVICII